MPVFDTLIVPIPFGLAFADPALWPIWIELPLKLCAPIASRAENVRNFGLPPLAPVTVTLRHSAQFVPVLTQREGPLLIVTPVPPTKVVRLSIPNVVPFEPVAVRLKGISTARFVWLAVNTTRIGTNWFSD